MNRREFFTATVVAAVSVEAQALAPVPKRQPIPRFAKDLKVGEKFWYGGWMQCVDHGYYTKEFHEGRYLDGILFGDKEVANSDGSPTYVRLDVPGWPGVTYYTSWMGPNCPINDPRFMPKEPHG